mmetsp:Transcript_25160/g.37181  ORF Transcript_25160/g.37181 Transcript_25160/m.37181 type:complete len:307 (+) Transcript_25160:92-1012(+)|eukprot:CAMPEP_0194225806 /NCGR_PEP_ID=MMETSP0156-20130528/40401_1 /TAXON_ID=33649 /ORGANISM="Thalassionema nitzschioides, Strain L26-B" /LENGTH=306 /DNA_ID=CAMNT_0038957905 /DNA_START=5 /DNA_END=925 /DNA_ORIENTATION=+
MSKRVHNNSPHTYTAVASSEAPGDEKYHLTATLVDDSVRPARAIESQYATLPELQNITWTDTFFDDDDDIIAVFDYDYNAMESFNTSTGFATWAALSLYPPLLGCSLACLTPCYLRANVRWSVRAQHVAVTRDGIRYVENRRKTGWGLSCTDRGKVSKTVPFDKITDCDVQEPAGNSCICIKNILSVVNVDTASSGQGGIKELRLAGLKNPHGFKKLVWAMKRSQGNGFPQVPASLEMARGVKTSNEPDVTSILLQIRDELRTHNDLLQSMKMKENLAANPAAVLTALDTLDAAVEGDSSSKSKDT